jgi:hypothetical protein
MVICQHQSMKRAVTGQRDTCPLCHLEIIHDGDRWVWLHSITPAKARKYERIYHANRIAGALA